jgi:TetR/AcrR family transcriptional regulator, repressor for neighboring sulfatase
MSQAPGDKESPQPREPRPSRAPAGKDQRPYGREEVRQALLDAAQHLIAERGPSSVTLREIAQEAGVNFGLVYQYLGTREELLREVYQAVAKRSAVRLEPIDNLPDAIIALMTIPRTSIARIMAWAVLEGDYPADVLGPSPALEHIAKVIAGHATGGPPTAPTEEDRLLAAFLLVTTMAWRLFKPIGLTSAGLDPAFDPKRDEKVTEWLQQLATVIAER